MNIANMINALKKLGVQNADELSPEAAEKVMKSLSGEMADAPNNLIGKGKNLEALNAVKQNAPSMEAPGYPKNVGRDEVNFTMPKEDPGFTMVPEGTQVPAVRQNTLPQAIPGKQRPDIVETTAEKLQPDNPFTVGQAKPQGLADIPEGSLGELDLAGQQNNILKKLLIGGGAAATGAGLIGGLMPEEQEALGQPAPIQKAQPAAAPVSQVKQSTGDKKAGNKPVTIQPPKPTPDVPKEEQPADYMELLKKAQADQKDMDFIDNMLRAGTTIGSSIAGTKADYAPIDALQKQNTRGVDNVQALMKTETQQNELNDEKKLRDPSSDVSKAFRSALAKLGIPHSEKTTAADAKALGINPQNLIMQDKQIAAMQAKSERDSGKRKQSFITSAQKMLLKPYQQYQKVATAKKALEGYLQGESSGPKDVAMLYEFIKGLDPDSAVKEGEIQLGKSAMSLLEQYGITARKLTNSDVLSPKFRTAVADILKSRESLAKENYEQIRQPVLLQSADYGLTDEDHGKLDYMSAASSKNEQSTFPKQVRNATTGEVATVSNEQELAEAQSEGFN